MNLTLKNCRALVNGRLVDVDILVESGRIRRIGKRLPVEGQSIDARNRIVIPGVIDPHVHFREPGLTHKEDFFSGSRAAAAGGVTTVLDMPNTLPPTTTARRLEEKRELARKSVVNYGFHFGAARDNLDEIKSAKNIASVKVYLNASTGKMCIKDEASLKGIFSSAQLITAHAEDEMIPKAIQLTAQYGNRLYLCHIPQKKDLDLIQKNRTRDIFVEVCPHHLFMTTDAKSHLGGFAEVRPPLASKADRAALWQAIRSGAVNAIGSDHAPHTREEKSAGLPPAGLPGVETLLPLLLDAVNRGLLTLDRLVALTSRNPAAIFGIRAKGHIRVGYDADLTLLDMGKTKAVRDDRLFTRCGWSPYNGLALKGWPAMTMVNGTVVFDGEQVLEGSRGKKVEYGI